MNNKILTLLIILFVFFHTSIKAEESSQIVINSDSLSVEDDDIAMFEGKVDLTHEDIIINSDKLKVFYTAPSADEKKEGSDASEASSHKVKYMEAHGNVVLKKDDDEAKSKHAYYDLKTGIIILEGDVFLQNNFGSIRGERLIYNKETGQTIIDKPDKKSSKRVSAYFNADLGTQG